MGARVKKSLQGKINILKELLISRNLDLKNYEQYDLKEIICFVFQKG